MKNGIVHLSEKLFNTAQIILFSLVLTFIISFVGLLFNIEISKAHYPIGFLLSLIILKLIDRQIKLLVPTVLSIIIITSSFYFLSKTYDASWDGQWYHQDAIIKLTNNWNPIYSKSDTTLSISDSDIWIHHYPHASWIAKATIFKLTGLIQSSKATTILFSICALFTSIYLLITILRLNIFYSIILSFCIALNPIAFSQFLSFCIDGEVAMMMSIYILLLISFAKKPSKILFVTLVLIFTYTVNIKFTTLVYLSIFNFFFFIWLIVQYKNKRAFIFVIFSTVYLISIFGLGYSSYTRNTFEKGHPLYPIMGENSYGHIVGKIPESVNFEGKNRFQNFVSASFGYPKYSRTPDSSIFRIPFTEVDYNQYNRVDSEISGFGARWSEIIILTLILLLLTLYFFRNKNDFKKYLIILGIILFSVFINEQCFVSRYVPQLWLFPIVICIYIFINGGNVLKSLTAIFVLFLIFNTFRIIQRQVEYQKEIRKNIKLENEYLKSFNKPIAIKCKYLSVPNRLKENNIPFTYIESETGKEHYQFNYTYEENYYIIP